MSFGDALIHGLLGGTAAASEHYVNDWRDRVKRQRDEKERASQREYQTGERVAQEQHLSDENQKNRNHQTAENVAQVQRYADLYDQKAEIDETYHKKAVQFGIDPTTNQLVPITQDDQQSIKIAPLAERDKDGNWTWFSDTRGKGLLGRSGGSSDSSSNKAFTNVKVPTGNPLSPTEDRTVFTDPDGQQWQIIPDGKGNMIRVPFAALTEHITPEQQAAANEFAEKTVNDMTGTFASDATDFADWGGSREAAKEYFRQNYLQGQHLDSSGRLRLPGSQEPAPEPKAVGQSTVQSNDRTDQFVAMYEQLSPEQQTTLHQAKKSIQMDNRDPALVQKRLLDFGFTPEQLALIF